MSIKADAQVADFDAGHYLISLKMSLSIAKRHQSQQTHHAYHGQSHLHVLVERLATNGFPSQEHQMATIQRGIGKKFRIARLALSSVKNNNNAKANQRLLAKLRGQCPAVQPGSADLRDLLPGSSRTRRHRSICGPSPSRPSSMPEQHCRSFESSAAPSSAHRAESRTNP